MEGSNGLLKELFSTKGRLNRRKYFFNSIIVPTISLILIVIIAIICFGSLEDIDLSQNSAQTGMILIIIVVILTCYASFAGSVKRLHDLNYSGYMILLTLIFGVNIYIWLILYFKKGTEGDNKYGHNPIKKVKTTPIVKYHE